jgi:hypothetical protein
MLVSNMRYVISSMFDLFVVSIGDLNRIIFGVLDSLIVGDGLLDWNLVSNDGLVILSVGSVVRDLFVGDFGLVVGVVFLDRDVLHVGMRLGGLVYSGGGQALGEILRHLRGNGGRVNLGLHKRSFQRLEQRHKISIIIYRLDQSL